MERTGLRVRQDITGTYRILDRLLDHVKKTAGFLRKVSLLDLDGFGNAGLLEPPVVSDRHLPIFALRETLLVFLGPRKWNKHIATSRSIGTGARSHAERGWAICAALFNSIVASWRDLMALLAIGQFGWESGCFPGSSMTGRGES